MILNGNNITKEYTRRGEKFPAVNNADFSAWSGDYTVIFGESGSGKSTLLNALAGISAPTSGCIAIDGQPLYTLNDEDRSKLRNERIGYIPQNAACLPALLPANGGRHALHDYCIKTRSPLALPSEPLHFIH